MESECFSNIFLGIHSIRRRKVEAEPSANPPQSFAYFSFLFAVHVVGIIMFLLGGVPPFLVKDHGGVFTAVFIVLGSMAMLASWILIIESFLLPKEVEAMVLKNQTNVPTELEIAHIGKVEKLLHR
nr:hypothetical protein [Tanacetum cinerariifolium]